MNDRRINDLVRMAMEVEELDAQASSPGLRLAGDPLPVVARRRAWFASMSGLVGMGLAAAAGLALVFALPAIHDHGQPSNTNSIAISNPGDGMDPKGNDIVRHIDLKHVLIDLDPRPAVDPPLAHAADRVDPGMVERSMIMAIYRGARGQMQCVKMKPHEWSENKCLTDVTSQELKCVSVGQACSASPDHALVVALSGPQKSLPRSDSDAVHLATCILGAPCENDSRCLSLSAADCLPAGVSVKIETVASSR